MEVERGVCVKERVEGSTITGVDALGNKDVDLKVGSRVEGA